MALHLTKGEAKLIMQQVRENVAALDSCVGPHDFEVMQEHTIGSQTMTNALMRNRYWQCSKCKGIIEASDKLWYEKGLGHGRK